jgi:ribonuclease P protein component
VETLRTGREFERVRREGRSWGTPLLVLNAAANGKEGIRCGFITGKKVGNAVHRNRARRLMKEAVRHRLPALPQGWDLVWIARAPLVEAEYAAVVTAVDDALRRARLLKPGNRETAGEQSRIIGVGEEQSDAASPSGEDANPNP